MSDPILPLLLLLIFYVVCVCLSECIFAVSLKQFVSSELWTPLTKRLSAQQVWQEEAVWDTSSTQHISATLIKQSLEVLTQRQKHGPLGFQKHCKHFILHVIASRIVGNTEKGRGNIQMMILTIF